MEEVFYFNEVHKEAFEKIIKNSLIIPLARRIHQGEFSSEHEFTPKEFQDLVESLSPEYYLLPVLKIKDVELCLNAERFMAAAMLLHSIIESMVNNMIRLLLYVRGFSHEEITSLQYTNLTPKINVILPLLNNPLPEQIKRWVKKLKDIRNLGTHEKALPVKGFNTKDTSVEHEKKAKELFDEMNIQDLKKGIDKFNDGIFLACPEICMASDIVSDMKVGDPIITLSDGQIRQLNFRE